MLDTIAAPAAIAAAPTPPEPTPSPAAPAPVAPEPAPPATPERMTDRIQRKLGELRNPKPPEPTPAPEPAKLAAVTPTAPTKAPEPDSDDALNAEIEKVAAKWEPGQKKAFTDKTYALREAKRQVKQLEAKVQAELEASKASPAATEDIQNQIAALSKRAEAAEAAAKAREEELAVTAVEKSPAWQSAIRTPMTAIESRAKELAKKYELNEWTVLTALHGTSDEQDEVAGAMKDADKIKFLSDAAKISDLDEKAAVLRTNAAEALEKMATMQASAAKEQAETQSKVHIEAYAAAHKENWKVMQESVPVLNAVQGDDDVSKNWNQHLVDSEKFAREASLSNLDVPTQSKLVARGSVYPLLVGAIDGYKKQLEVKTTELTEALDRLSKFEKSKPAASVAVNDGIVAPVVAPKPGDAAKRIATALFPR